MSDDTSSILHQLFQTDGRAKGVEQEDEEDKRVQTQPVTIHVRPSARRRRPTLLSSSRSSSSDSSPTLTSSLPSVLDGFVKRLCHQGTNLVLLDFDKTLVGASTHPNGQYNSVAEIQRAVTPLFLPLLQRLKKNGISVALATFNLNPLIEPAICALANSNIPVYAREDSRLGTGKLWHCLTAMHDLDRAYGRSHRQRTIPSQVVLIDDDPHNIHVAHTLGFGTVANPDVLTAKDLRDHLDLPLPS